MAESGIQPKEKEQEDAVRGKLEQLAEEELGETEEVRACTLNEMKHWLQSQPHIHNCRTDDNFLLRFLRMQKFRFTTKGWTRAVQYFRNLDISRPELKELVDQNINSSSDIFDHGAFWLHVCTTRKRFFWSKGDLSYSQVPRPLAPFNGGCDQSNCHHSGNSSRGRGEPN